MFWKTYAGRCIHLRSFQILYSDHSNQRYSKYDCTGLSWRFDKTVIKYPRKTGLKAIDMGFNMEMCGKDSLK